MVCVHCWLEGEAPRKPAASDTSCISLLHSWEDCFWVFCGAESPLVCCINKGTDLFYVVANVCLLKGMRYTEFQLKLALAAERCPKCEAVLCLSFLFLIGRIFTDLVLFQPLAVLGIELLECLYWRRGALLYMFCHTVKGRQEWLTDKPALFKKVKPLSFDSSREKTECTK